MNSLTKYQFSFNTSIYKFLNNKTINILQLIFQNPEIQSKSLIRLINKKILISRSTSFRYLSSLHNNNLVKKKFKSKRSKLAYVFYDLTYNGKQMLHLFKEFLVKKILLKGLLKGKKYCKINENYVPNIKYLESKFWYNFRDLIFFGKILIVKCEIRLINQERIKVKFLANCFNKKGKKVLKIAIFDIPFESGDLK